MLSEADQSSAGHVSDLDKQFFDSFKNNRYLWHSMCEQGSSCFRLLSWKQSSFIAELLIIVTQLLIQRRYVIVQVRNASGAAEILYRENTATYDDVLAWRQHS